MPIHRVVSLLPLLALTLTIGACAGADQSIGQPTTSQQELPRVKHVVMLVMENFDYENVVGSANAPYLNSLMRQGSLAANYYANYHPSLPNYFVLTTGESLTNGNSSPVFGQDNVVRELDAVSLSW